MPTAPISKKSAQAEAWWRDPAGRGGERKERREELESGSRHARVRVTAAFPSVRAAQIRSRVLAASTVVAFGAGVVVVGLVAVARAGRVAWDGVIVVGFFGVAGRVGVVVIDVCAAPGGVIVAAVVAVVVLGAVVAVVVVVVVLGAVVVAVVGFDTEHGAVGRDIDFPELAVLDDQDLELTILELDLDRVRTRGCLRGDDRFRSRNGAWAVGVAVVVVGIVRGAASAVVARTAVVVVLVIVCAVVAWTAMIVVVVGFGAEDVTALRIDPHLDAAAVSKRDLDFERGHAFLELELRPDHGAVGIGSLGDADGFGERNRRALERTFVADRGVLRRGGLGAAGVGGAIRSQEAEKAHQQADVGSPIFHCSNASFFVWEERQPARLASLSPMSENVSGPRLSFRPSKKPEPRRPRAATQDRKRAHSAARPMGIPTRLEKPNVDATRQTVVRLSFLDTDPKIVAALRAGQPAGGAALYDRYHEHVRRVLVRLIGPSGDLGDLVQDVFVSAIDSIQRLEDPNALKSWLAGIAVFRVRAEFRARARRRLFPLFGGDELPETPAVEAGPELTETVRATYQVLDRMSADDRIVFALRYIERMELSEVAETCVVSIATVKRRIARAQKRFVAIAKHQPALDDWLRGGDTWT
jgi:RNA polymerase sigma-70 factor, ECF subfamily